MMHPCTLLRGVHAKGRPRGVLVLEGGKHTPRGCVDKTLRPSVTFMNSVKTSNHILRLFSPLGIQTTLVFPYQTS